MMMTGPASATEGVKEMGTQADGASGTGTDGAMGATPEETARDPAMDEHTAPPDKCTTTQDALDYIVSVCKGMPGFLQEFDRLTGTTFTRGTPLEQAIDIATGKRAADEQALERFVAEYVMGRLKEAN
jgi:hypothetical protein